MIAVHHDHLQLPQYPHPSSASQIRGLFLFLTLGYIFIFNYVYTCAGA